MPRSPEITSILAVPGIGSIDHATAPSDQLTKTVFIGLVIDGATVHWGSCSIFPGEYLPDQPLSVGLSQALSTIETVVAPVLTGQRLTNFRKLVTSIESLTETVTFSEVVYPERQVSPGFSRREIISGSLSSLQEVTVPPRVTEKTIERLLHPALRLGVSQALLAAVAWDRRLTMAEILAEEFELHIPTSAVAIEVAIHRGQTLHLSDRFAALGYASGASDPEKSLGVDGERIQRFVRQLRENITRAEVHHPIAIHLDVSGGLGQLYGGNIGKILGALYGLEQAAAPSALYVTDPLIRDNLDAQIESMAKLRDYLQMRVMSLRLVAGAYISSLADVNSFVQSSAAHMLHLSMARLGTIQETVLAIQACRANGLGVLLAGDSSELVAQVALATQPDLFVSSSDRAGDADLNTFHNEILRTLAWLAHKS